jgi:predicted RNase H-like nuclease
MSRLSPRPDRKNLKPGDVVRLPRRMIDAVLRAGSDDRVVIREVHPRVVFVQSLANPWAAWYVRRRVVTSTPRHRCD